MNRSRMHRQSFLWAPIFALMLSPAIALSQGYIVGADISSLPERIDNGAVFVDTDGREKGIVELLASHGFNYVRLRTFVDPLADYGYASDDGCRGKSEPYNDKDHVVAFARQVKAAGLGLLLDFHYSDTWADPGKQVIPRAWRDAGSVEALARSVREYTTGVMQALAAADALPDMVQIGNEITPGLLIHVPTAATDCFGSNSVLNPAVNGSARNWDNLALLLGAGIDAVRSVHADARIMLHIENTEDPDAIEAWVRNARSRGLAFDVLGLSAYERWQGPAREWPATFARLHASFPDLDLSIVEYGGHPGLVNEIMRGLPDDRGIGTFVWEPIPGGGDNALFERDGDRFLARADGFAPFEAIAAGQSALAAYFFPFFRGEGDADGEQIYFALSRGNDPLRYEVLNNGRPVLTSAAGERGLRDPFVLRAADGERFFMLATDLRIYGNGDWDAAQRQGSRSIMVFESDDLVHWSPGRLVQVAPATAGNTWAPEAFYDESDGVYRVYWASRLYADDDPEHSGDSYNRMLMASTRDFETFTEASVWIDPGYSVIDSTVIEHDGFYYRFTKDERSATAGNPCGKFIVSERARDLRSANYELLSDCIGRPGISRGEGPTIFKSNAGERWYLFIDEFGGRGYVPFVTSDLAAPADRWTLADDFEFPARPRHGTVLPITALEQQRLLAAWQSEPAGAADAVAAAGGGQAGGRSNAAPAREYAAYFFPHFIGESTADGEAIYFAVSDGNDPTSWITLNRGRPVLSSTQGTRGLRDPFIIRSADGERFWLLATDLKINGGGNFGDAQQTGSRSLMIWESDNLVDWSAQREVTLAPANAGNAWAPEAYWDEASGSYLVYWASALYPEGTPPQARNIADSYQRMLIASTRDFVGFSAPAVWIDEPRGPGRGMIDSTVAEQDGVFYRLTKDESYYGMRQESSTDLRLSQGVSAGDGWNLIAERVGFGQPNPWGGLFTAGEGPTIFRSNTDETWYQLQDQPSYHGGRGYVLFATDDIASAAWRSLPDAALPASPRHGTVIPITAAEYRNLLARYGDD